MLAQPRATGDLEPDVRHLNDCEGRDPGTPTASADVFTAHALDMGHASKDNEDCVDCD